MPDPTIPARRALRVRVWLTRAKLDRQIAAGSGATGEAVGAREALALRVEQLTGEGARRETARDLRRVVQYADRHASGPVISCVVVNRAAVRAGREAILGLSERLEGDAPVRAPGVVLARELLADGISPLHNPHCRQTVSEAVFAVQDALGGHPASAFDAIAA